GHELLDDEGVPCGLAAVGGDCPTVGTSGFSLGGGYGILTRRYGLGCDNILEAEGVDASGGGPGGVGTRDPGPLWAPSGGGRAGPASGRHPAPLPAARGPQDGLRRDARVAPGTGRGGCSRLPGPLHGGRQANARTAPAGGRGRPPVAVHVLYHEPLPGRGARGG